MEEIHNECNGLIPAPGAGHLQRIYKRGKNLYNAKTVEKKIIRLRDGLRDAKMNFLVRSVNLYSDSQCTKRFSSRS